VAVIGSGFGGSVSVSALRLAEKGWRVAMLEQGRELDDAALAERFHRFDGGGSRAASK
jgi:cholesterol oxidase